MDGSRTGETEGREALKTYVIGRSSAADIVLADDSVTSRHAEVVVTDDGRFFVTDCLTASGTWRSVAASEGGDAAERALWEPIRQAFVGADMPVRFGEHVCTLGKLFSGPREGRAGEGERPGAAGAPADRPHRPRGRVERDAITGEIVRKRP